MALVSFVSVVAFEIMAFCVSRSDQRKIRENILCDAFKFVDTSAINLREDSPYKRARSIMQGAHRKRIVPLGTQRFGADIDR